MAWKRTSVTNKIVGISIGAIMLATLGWTAFQQIFAANTTDVDPTVVILGTTTLSIIIAIAYMKLFLDEAGL
ncbi:hypothetical protein DRN85_05675 [Methanosarcinales archaeon]|nr:MAG: hypothetical protein DRN85_05675 [Methanosarcinales archaeon]